MAKQKKPHDRDASGANEPATSQQNGEPNELSEKPKPRKTGTDSSKKGPAGGFDDSTPVPYAPPGYTVKITFHRATNLPLADINSLSSDPFILAQINTALPTRHKEDPPLQLRTKTIRQNTNPVWNQEWIVANVPASGFRLKCRLYDEDPADHDDRLGNAHVEVGSIDDSWPGIRDRAYPIKKRMGSKRAYLVRSIAVCFGKVEHMHGFLHVSVQSLGRTNDESGGRTYTIGPQFWIRHYSPLLGRLLGQKEPREEGGENTSRKPKAERYNFQANQMQLRGPVPATMYHRYVEFKPFVKSMFTATGIRGFLLSKALHHQHSRVYNYDGHTEYDSFREPCHDFTLKFLELVHFDQGGRIFTYVLTLDSLFRFTETGKEFGIDMLSKHTMHSDVAAYIAFSGEFFIRRMKDKRRTPPEQGGGNQSHPPDEIEGGPPKDEPKRDPSYYQLVIDNDSGTYRPNAKLLPDLKAFFEANFPGLHVTTLDSQGDAEKMSKMKEEQRERKKKEGEQRIFTQFSDASSLSSSDIEDLDRLEQTGEMQEPHFRHYLKKEAEVHAEAAKSHLKGFKPSHNREGWRGPKHPPGQDDETVQKMREEAGQAEPSNAEKVDTASGA